VAYGPSGSAVTPWNAHTVSGSRSRTSSTGAAGGTAPCAWKKSAASIGAACARRKVRHVVSVRRWAPEGSSAPRSSQARSALGTPHHRRNDQVDIANQLHGARFDITIVLHPLSGRRDATIFHFQADRLCVLAFLHRHACIVVAHAGIADLLDAIRPTSPSTSVSPRRSSLTGGKPTRPFSLTLLLIERRCELTHGCSAEQSRCVRGNPPRAEAPRLSDLPITLCGRRCAQGTSRLFIRGWAYGRAPAVVAGRPAE
jgi:hypothetical protein